MPEAVTRHAEQIGDSYPNGSAGNHRTANRIEDILGVIPERVRHSSGGLVHVTFNAVDLDQMLDQMERAR